MIPLWYYYFNLETNLFIMIYHCPTCDHRAFLFYKHGIPPIHSEWDLELTCCIKKKYKCRYYGENKLLKARIENEERV